MGGAPAETLEESRPKLLFPRNIYTGIPEDIVASGL